MNGLRTTAGGIPLDSLNNTFSAQEIKKKTFIGVPDSYATNWSARAYILQEDRIIGPLLPFYSRDKPHGIRIISGVGEQAQLVGIEAQVEHYMFGEKHIFEAVKQFIEEENVGMIWLEPELEAGEYYPRIWRSGYIHSERGYETFPLVEWTKYYPSFVASVQRFERLCLILDQLFHVVYPSSQNKSAFGSEMRSAIILACTEVECQWRAIFDANGYNKKPFTTTDYVKLLPALRLNEYKIKLRPYPLLDVICPFMKWNSSAPTKSLPWYDAYNRLKHDPENCINMASLIHSIEAVSAVFILLVAQFGIMPLRNIFRNCNLFLHEFPRWTPDKWHYEPPPHEAYREVMFTF